MCGLNVANIFVVGLLSALIGAGAAYFLLVKSADFQLWWLLVLFGAQFISVIVVACAFKKASHLNTMFCETPVLVMPNYDWSASCTVPKPALSDCVLFTNKEIDTHSANWQDLLQQLDQMSNASVATEVVVSDAGYVPAVAQLASPAEVPTFDFSSIAKGLATSGPAISPASDKGATVSMSTPVVTTSVGAKSVTASVEPGGFQGIDFSALFR